MTRFGKPGLAMLSTAIFLSPAFSAKGQEVRHYGPAQMRVELDNPSMSVLRLVLGPHEKTGMHDVSARLIVWLTEAHLRDAMADGSTREYGRAAGTVEWIPAQRHAGENLSDQPIAFLAIIPKMGRPFAPISHDHDHR
jgi:hypothetical protein